MKAPFGAMEAPTFSSEGSSSYEHGNPLGAFKEPVHLRITAHHRVVHVAQQYTLQNSTCYKTLHVTKLYVILNINVNKQYRLLNSTSQNGICY
jgi:hypothetical protein